MSANESTAGISLALHEAVFHNQPDKLRKLIDEDGLPIAQKDMHGNTPLHLCTMLHRLDCLKILMDRNAPIKIKVSVNGNQE